MGGSTNGAADGEKPAEKKESHSDHRDEFTASVGLTTAGEPTALLVAALKPNLRWRRRDAAKPATDVSEGLLALKRCLTPSRRPLWAWA